MFLKNFLAILISVGFGLIAGCAEAGSDDNSLDWVMEKHIKAVGGAKAMNAIHSREYHGISTGENNNGTPFETKWVSYMDRSGRSYNESYVRDEGQDEFVLQTQMAMQPSGGWHLTGKTGDVYEYPADQAAGMVEARTDTDFKFPVEYKSMVTKHNLTRLPDERINETLYHVIKLGEKDSPMTNYINSETFMIDKTVMNFREQVITEQLFSDFRKVDGIMSVFKIQITTRSDIESNPKTETIEVKEAKYNKPFDEKLLERPANP
jgi:hypothetical protein